MKKIIISDSTLSRESANFSFKEKIEIARQLDKLCVNAIELSEIVNLKTDKLFVKTISSFIKNTVISLCGGKTVESVLTAAETLSLTKKPRIRIELPLSAVGMEYVCHIKQPQMNGVIAELVSTAKSKCSDVEFCVQDATRTEKDFLFESIKTAVENGANIITVCDDAAETMPNKFAEFVYEIKQSVDDSVQVAVSCSDKNGLANADALLSLEKGADMVKTCVGGNIVSLESFAGMVKNCGNSYGIESGIKYTELNRIIKQILWVKQNSKNEKSAITVANNENNNICLDINDNKEAVVNAANKLGYDLSEEDCNNVYEEFCRVVEKKTVGLKELEAIIASVALQVPPTYKLVSYVVNSGNIISATAQIKLLKNGKELEGISIGDGPIDAALLAIDNIIGHHYELDDFQIQSVTEGKEAMGSTLVKLRNDGKLYSGNGISTDIIGASIRAYLNAVNKIVYEEN